MSDLIEREYLLNIARQEEAYGYVSEHEILNAPTAETTGALDDAIQEYIKDGYILAEPKWIPCEERLPDETEAVYLICTEGGYMCSCRWTNVNPLWTDLTTEWHWSPFDKPQYSKVVAWMPLKPYEMERSE